MQAERSEDTYPIGFDCEERKYNGGYCPMSEADCFCWNEEFKRQDDQTRQEAEYYRLLDVKFDMALYRMAMQSMTDRPVDFAGKHDAIATLPHEWRKLRNRLWARKVNRGWQWKKKR